MKKITHVIVSVVISELTTLQGNVLPQINECYLLHGTKSSVVDFIKEGFDFRQCSEDLLFGKGVYFAECTTKADQHTGKQSSARIQVYRSVRCQVTSHCAWFLQTNSNCFYLIDCITIVSLRLIQLQANRTMECSPAVRFNCQCTIATGNFLHQRANWFSLTAVVLRLTLQSVLFDCIFDVDLSFDLLNLIGKSDMLIL